MRGAKRVLVVGLDGVPASLVRRFTSDGTMPALGELAGRGVLSEMTATLPEISSVSWSSFMTGENPGRHGIFGFTDLVPGTYRIRFPTFRDLGGETLWDRLGGRGMRSVVVNQPATYPARPIPGILISGFVAPDLARGVHPPGLLGRLEGIGYRVDVDTMRCRKDHGYLIEDLDRTLRARERAVEALWDEPWDLFQVVVTGTDRLHHYLWDALDDPQHAFHGAFREYYRKVDGFLGRLVGRFTRSAGCGDPESGLFLLSDHGFCGIRSEFYLNRWLVEEGYLGWRKESPEGVSDLSGGSRAFALDPGRIYLNHQGRYPRGCVRPGEADRLGHEIRSRLEGLRFEGDRVVRRVWTRGEAYRGPRAQEGPDLVVETVPGFDVKASVRRSETFGRSDLAGMHTRGDAFFWSSTPVGGDWNIADCAGIIASRLLGNAGERDNSREEA